MTILETHSNAFAVDDHVVVDFINGLTLPDLLRQRMLSAASRARQAQEAEYRRMGKPPYMPMWRDFRSWLRKAGSQPSLIEAVYTVGRVRKADMHEFAKSYGYPNGGWQGFVQSDDNLGLLREVDGYYEVSLLALADIGLGELLRPFV